VTNQCTSLSATISLQNMQNLILQISCHFLLYLTLPPLFLLLPGVESIRGLAHAAGFAAARRCLRFLVVIGFSAPSGTLPQKSFLSQ